MSLASSAKFLVVFQNQDPQVDIFPIKAIGFSVRFLEYGEGLGQKFPGTVRRPVSLIVFGLVASYLDTLE